MYFSEEVKDSIEISRNSVRTVWMIGEENRRDRYLNRISDWTSGVSLENEEEFGKGKENVEGFGRLLIARLSFWNSLKDLLIFQEKSLLK